MAIEIKVPDMGESVIEATIINWIKHEGDQVAAGDAVVELETDKITLEVSAQQKGILERIAHQAGETVKVGDVLAFVAPDSGPGPMAAQPEDPAKSRPAEEAVKTPDSASVPAEVSSEPGGNGSARATPVAERMAREMGIDLAKVNPSGSGGRVTKEDVQTFFNHTAEKQTPATETSQAVPAQGQKAPAVQTPALGPNTVTQVPEHAAARAEKRIHMSRRRQTIARRLVEAQQTAAMLTTFNEIDMSAVIDVRKRRREDFKQRFGVDLGYMSFFVKASIGALKAFPNVNAEIQGDEIVQKYYYDIGIAIGAEEGLVVPVLRDADRLNFAGIEKGIREVADKVKASTLSLEDLRGGTFTITNGGIYGSLMSTPILNPPQVGILGMHAIKERPVAVGGQVVIRPMMYTALTYDHRIVDGREAVQFLVRIKELVEDPETLLFG